jgi:hypothetical protein
MGVDNEALRLKLSELEDQIAKGHWLNVHFRAFELAYDAWKLHIRANAQLGARYCGSLGGAVLDAARDGRDNP